VARRSDWSGCRRRQRCADGSPDPFAGSGQLGPTGGRELALETSTLIQYWYFYSYDEWRTPVAVGQLTQAHAADWEVVTVGLSRTAPLWVAYSQHCAGSYAEWSHVRVAGSDPRRLRPLVAVANGSHANYLVAEQSRVPNFAECSNISQDRLKLLSYAANIRDRTDDKQPWAPTPSELHLVRATSPEMGFPGWWGPFDRMRLQTFHRDFKFPARHGPASPALQALWQAPVRNILGGGKWKRESPD
jgi:hypothetical protein